MLKNVLKFLLEKLLHQKFLIFPKWLQEVFLNIFENINLTELQKLEREARICRKLSHPNIGFFYFTLFIYFSTNLWCYYTRILSLHDFWTVIFYLFIFFNSINGGELFDDIVARECYSEQDARYFYYYFYIFSQIMHQILDAIHYCHGNNIIHRDLKVKKIYFKNK